MAGVITTAVHPKLLLAGFRKVYQNEFVQMAPEYTDYTNAKTSSHDLEKDTKIGGIQATMPEKPQNDPVQYDETVEGGTKEYVNKTYGLGVKISWEMREDERYNKMNQLASLLGRTGRNLPEVVGISIFNNATATGAAYLGFDAKPLLSTSHTYLKTGGTWANRPANDVDLGFTALQMARIHFRRMKDDSEIPSPIKPNKLFINPEDEFLAREIMNSPGKPHEMSNTLNVMKDSGIGIHVLSYLTDDDFWIVQAPGHDANFQWRTRIIDDSELDFDSRTLKFAIFGRCCAGFGEARGHYGTPGA